MSIRAEITPAQVVDFLNGAAALDPKAMWNLIQARIGCAPELANHPTIQVGQVPGSPGFWDVGMLGVINGMFGVHDDGPAKGMGAIWVQYDKTTGEPWKGMRFGLVTQEMMAQVR